MDYFEGRLLTHDWTSHHLKTWESLLGDMTSSSVDVVEVGSFEGRSALFFLQFLPRSRIICIDTFGGSVEHVTGVSQHASNMAAVESRFDENMKPFAARVEKRKGHSITILAELRAQDRLFDIAYVDGDHRAAPVFADARLSWNLLKNGGVLILDDYRWKLEAPVAERPAAGINAFLQDVAGEFDLLHQGEQIIIRKNAPVTRETALVEASSITIAGRDINELAGGALTPPLVSFVIIAWNYGRYVGATIDSVRKQDYPHFECIVINNGSTDDSAEVIARHIAGDSRFKVETLAENRGQLGAALWALDKIKGGFVTFVDADDVLFENYASMHVQVHLALPKSVAFTSANVTEMDADGKALTSSHQHHDLKRDDLVHGLRPAQTVIRLPRVGALQYRFLADHTASIPRRHTGWLWAPGSANMFRASLLRLVRLNDGSQPTMQAADTYFNTICHAFAGSALIDMPLSGYRLHASNYFSTGESLAGIRAGSGAFAKKSADLTYESIDFLLRESDRYDWILSGAFWTVINQLTLKGRRALRAYFSDPRAVEMFTRHAPKLVAVFGANVFRRQVLVRFSGGAARAILRAGMGRHLSLPTHVRLLANDLRATLRTRRKR